MKTSRKIVYWIPRILCILAILFLTMFGLDEFDGKHTFWQEMFGFFMHSIPSLVLAGLLIVAWKWELTGGIIFTILGLLFTPYIYVHNYNMNHSFWISLSVIALITFPFILVGILFLVSYRLGEKEKTEVTVK